MSLRPAFTIGDVSVYEGDCREVVPSLRGVAAVIVDPPYGTAVARDGYGRRQNYGGVGRHIQNDDDLSVVADTLALLPGILPKHAWVAVFCSPKRHAEVAWLAKTSGLPVVGEVVWDKAVPGLGGGIRYQHETILLCAQGRPSGRDSLHSVARHFLTRENAHKRHPHEKPVPLLTSIVRYCSRPGELILDCFAGSGATAVACVKTGRPCLLVESDPQWLPLIRHRLESARTPLLEGLAT